MDSQTKKEGIVEISSTATKAIEKAVKSLPQDKTTDNKTEQKLCHLWI